MKEIGFKKSLKKTTMILRLIFMAYTVGR